MPVPGDDDTKHPEENVTKEDSREQGHIHFHRLRKKDEPLAKRASFSGT